MNKKRKLGFTLVEMLVVVAIVGILSTVLYSSYKRYLNTTKLTVSEAELYTIVECFEAAMIDNGRTQIKNGEITPESFTNFTELLQLDLVEVYNYISDIKLPANITLQADEKNIKYIDTQDGVELLYDTTKREIVSRMIY